MTNEQLLNALKGHLVIGELSTKDCYVLALVSKKEKLIIPLLRQDGFNSAYIDPDKYDDEQYVKLAAVIDNINSSKIFPILKYIAKSKAEPEFDKTIVKFVKPTGIEHILPKGIEGILKDAGYTMKVSESSLPTTPKDYGTIVEDNELYKKIYEDYKAELDAKGIPYTKFENKAVELEYQTTMAGLSDGALFVGANGTGKTTIFRAWAVRAKAPFFYFQISPFTEPSELEGSWTKDPQTGDWVFQEGPLLQAWYLGGVFGCDELNFAFGGTNSCLNKYLDGTRFIELNHKVYEKHPNFTFLGGMNAGYEDTQKLNQALKNRFAIIQLEPLTEELFIQRLVKHSEWLGHKISDQLGKEIFKYAKFMQQQADSSQFHEQIEFSYRNAEKFIDRISIKACNFEEFTEALHNSYTNGLSLDQNNVYKLINLKHQEEVNNYIKTIYGFYDFSEAKKVDLADDLDALFAEPEETEDAKTSSDFDKIKDDLYNRFDL